MRALMNPRSLQRAAARQVAMQRLAQRRAAPTTEALGARGGSWGDALFPNSPGEFALEVLPDVLGAGMVMATLPEDLAQQQGRLMPGLEELGWGLAGSLGGRAAGAAIGSRLGGNAHLGAMIGGMTVPYATAFTPRNYINEYTKMKEQELAQMQTAAQFRADGQAEAMQQLYGMF